MSNRHQQPNGGLYLELVDFDALYESVADRVMLINDVNIWDEDEKDELNDRLRVEYEDSILDTVPTCDCGKYRGEYNVGMRCRSCGTIVVSPTEKPIESVLWMRVPEGVHSFISPQVWNILSKEFVYHQENMLEWLTTSNYITKSTNPKAARLLEWFSSNGWKRSLNHFIENFDWATNVLIENGNFSPVARREVMRRFIEQNRHCFFPQYLPIPNRLLFIVEKNSTSKFADNLIGSAFDAVWTLMSVNDDQQKISQRKRENRTVTTIRKLSNYYEDYIKSNLGRKPGMYRRQVFGSRLDFSSRAVIISKAGVHNYEDIEIPWGIGAMMFKLHITNKLLRRGFTPTEAERFILSNTLRYNPLLDEIFQELLNESPKGKIPVLFQRNPTLLRGSAQLLYISRIKTDVDDNAISLSTLVLEGFNAD